MNSEVSDQEPELIRFKILNSDYPFSYANLNNSPS
jgi:hypothetical protein